MPHDVGDEGADPLGRRPGLFLLDPNQERPLVREGEEGRDRRVEPERKADRKADEERIFAGELAAPTRGAALSRQGVLRHDRIRCARIRSEAGRLSPRAAAAFSLMTSSKLRENCTGNSATSAPRRMRSI